MRKFYSFYVFLHEFFTVLTTFWRISAKTHELLAPILCCWHPYCAVGVHIVLLASLLMLVLLLASLLFLASFTYKFFFDVRTSKFSGILVVAGLHSAVDTVMFLLSLLLLASLHAVAGYFCKHPCF
jgi:hypothetical protein